MTEYSNVPDANALHAQAEQVSLAISYIDGGGTLGSFAMLPPPYDSATGASMRMTVQIIASGPTDPATLAALREWCVARQAAIDAELAALGVTNPPARAA